MNDPKLMQLMQLIVAGLSTSTIMLGLVVAASMTAMPQALQCPTIEELILTEGLPR